MQLQAQLMYNNMQFPHCSRESHLLLYFSSLFIIPILMVAAVRKTLLTFLVVLLTFGQAKLVIQSPPELALFFKQKYPDASIPYSIANYGDVPYGKTISGQMAIPTVLEDCLYEEIQAVSKRKIILLQRNDCSFTQKSLNVEKEGGKLAIIMDNVVQDSGGLIMVDDGKGSHVSIPTVLINRIDGLQVLKYIEDGVIASITFEVSKSLVSQVQLWIDISNHKNFVFLRNFRPYFQRIHSKVSFAVLYPTNRCSAQCSSDNCYFQGRYCRTPFGFNSIDNGGKQLINEQLRQQLIYLESPDKWWDYMDLFDQTCDDLAVYEQCSRSISSQLKIDFHQIQSRANKSFTPEDNELLKENSQRKYNNSILFYPTIIVNSLIYRGNLQANDVFALICQSMNPLPQECGAQPEGPSSLTSWIVFGVISVIVFLVMMIVCFRRLTRRQISSQMNKKVEQLVNQYITFYESDKFKEGIELKPK